MDEDATLLTSPGLDPFGRSESRNSHVLIMTGSDAAERRIPLGSEPLVVGRTPPCALLLPSGSVSRQHCQFRVAGDQAEVVDLGSTNGTFVNGHRIAGATPLPQGAQIRVGTYSFVYECRTHRELQDAQAAEQERQSASRYVQMLLPKPIHDGPVRAEWLFLPCARLGGTAFGYRLLSNGCFAGFMIDVAGHGTEAAMHSVAIMNLLRQPEVVGVDLSDPPAILDKLTRSFPPEAHGGLFFSCAYFAFDPSTRTLRYGSGGKHPAYLCKPGGDVLELRTDDPAVGLATETSFQLQSAAAPPGSRLYLFSEGISDSLDRLAGPGAASILPELIAAGTSPGIPEPSRLYHALQGAAGLSKLDDDCAIVTCAF